jgi:electron transfer flavoprotein beta subunit
MDRAGGKVTLVSLGKESTGESLRRGIALGADEAMLLCDPAFNNCDSFTTALVLAKAIAQIPCDLIFCGHKADDTQMGMVSSYLSQLLNVSLVRGIVKLELDKDKLRLHRKLEKGHREVVECPLPALLTVEAGLNQPRHATIRGVLRARSSPIKRYDAQNLGLSVQELQQVARINFLNITPPKPKMKGLFVPDAKLSAADKMKAIMGGGLVQKKSNFLEGDPEKIAQQLVQFFKKEKVLPG